MILWNFVELHGEQIGTGYFIAEDRVLTSRHVVGERETVKMLGDLPNESAEWTGRVIWRGQGHFDAAVVEVVGGSPRPPGFTGLFRRPLERDRQEWSSRGAVAGAMAPDRFVAFGGEAYASTEGACHLQVEITTKAATIEDWRGISGAPVFVGARLLGLIVGATESFPESPKAVAVPTLLDQDEAFRTAIHWQDRTAKDQWIALSQEILELLASDEVAARALVTSLGSFRGTYQHDQHVRQLGRLLCEEASFTDALTAIYKAHKHLSSARERHRRSLGVLEALLGWVLPLHCEKQFMGEVSAVGGGALLSLPLATPSVAEIYVAWLDGRAVQFDAPAEPSGPSRPRFMVPAIAEGGMDAQGMAREMAEDQARILERDSTEDLGAWRSRLADRFLSKAERAELSGSEGYDDEVFDWIKDTLEFKADLDNERHYLVFDPEFANRHRALLRVLDERLPLLRQIELTGDRNQMRIERRTLLPLYQLLHRIHHEDT